MSDLNEIFVNTLKCTGCQTCRIACSVAHSKSKNLFGAISEMPAPRSRIYVEYVPPDTKVPILCRHCEDAPCVNACISGAITRTEKNTVLTDSDKCIGCWTCVMVCPYGVIGRDSIQAKAFRCDRCEELDMPACVSACPTRALVWGTVEHFSKEKRKTVSKELVAGEGE